MDYLKKTFSHRHDLRFRDLQASMERLCFITSVRCFVQIPIIYAF